MKSIYSLALMVAAGTMLITTAPLRASETDDRIEASAKKSYAFKTYLTEDSIKTKSKNGAVTLTGINGVKSVINNMPLQVTAASNN